MQPGELIREHRRIKKITQVNLAEIIGLTQGYVSDIERGRQSPSREFIKKISGILELSTDDISFLVGAIAPEEPKEMWPDAVRKNQKLEYGIQGANRERRLPQNAPKRKVIDKVIKILDSGNKKAVKALKSNIDALFSMVETREPKLEGGD